MESFNQSVKYMQHLKRPHWSAVSNKDQVHVTLHAIFLHLSADAFFKVAITLVSEVPQTLEIEGKNRLTDPMLLEYLSHLTATLLLVPVSKCLWLFPIS